MFVYSRPKAGVPKYIALITKIKLSTFGLVRLHSVDAEEDALDILGRVFGVFSFSYIRRVDLQVQRSAA